MCRVTRYSSSTSGARRPTRRVRVALAAPLAHSASASTPTAFTKRDATAGGRAHPPTLPHTPQYFESDAADVYEVACIVGHKIENYVDMYRVHWAGYSHTENTWEPEANLNGSMCTALLQEYKMHNHGLIAHHHARAQQHSDGNSSTIKRKRGHGCH